MPERDAKGMSQQDRVRKGLCNKILTSLDELPRDAETVTMLLWIAAFTAAKASDMAESIAKAGTDAD